MADIKEEIPELREGQINMDMDDERFMDNIEMANNRYDTNGNFMVNDPNLAVPEPIIDDPINNDGYDINYNDNGNKDVVSNASMISGIISMNKQDKRVTNGTFDVVWKIIITILCLYSAGMVSYMYLNMNNSDCNCDGYVSALQSNENSNSATGFPSKSPSISPSITPSLITIEPTNTPSANPSYIFNDGITNMFASKLPYRNKCFGSSTIAPLHLETNYRIDNPHDLIYNIEFRGYIYSSNKNFYIIASGYYRGSNSINANGLDRKTEQYVINPNLLTLSYGVSNNSHFEFILTLGNDWHASDIIINKIGGSQCWHKNGNSLEIIHAYHD